MTSDSIVAGSYVAVMDVDSEFNRDRGIVEFVFGSGECIVDVTHTTRHKGITATTTAFVVCPVRKLKCLKS